MKKENFKLLLTDLYNIYNPAHIVHVDDLIERYHRIEADSIKNIFLKYNRKGTSHYDPQKLTDEYALDLIKQYESGQRPLENISIDDLINKNVKGQETKENTKYDIIKDSISKELQDDIDLIKKDIFKGLGDQFKTMTELVNDKVKQFKELETKINSKAAELEKLVGEKLTPQEDNLIIRSVFNYKGAKAILPSNDILLKLGVRSRLISRDEEGKTSSFVISDITCDTMSDDKPIVEIWIEKESV